MNLTPTVSTWNHALVEISLLYKQIGAMAHYISFFSCIILSIYLFEVTDSAPHKDIHQVNQELQKRDFRPLTSDSDFKNSITCNSCGLTLTYGDSAKAMWLVKRHSKEESHKIKAGWYLDDDNNVLSSKPKGKAKQRCQIDNSAVKFSSELIEVFSLI